LKLLSYILFHKSFTKLAERYTHDLGGVAIWLSKGGKRPTLSLLGFILYIFSYQTKRLIKSLRLSTKL